MAPTGPASHKTSNDAQERSRGAAGEAVAPGRTLAQAAVGVKSLRCKGCGLCVEACTAGGLEMGSEQNPRGYVYPVRVVEAVCTGCGNCYEACPDCAIVVYRKGCIPETADEVEEIRTGLSGEG